MNDVIRVGIADMKLCDPPDKITTVGLGSCVGVVLYDKITRHSGLVHIMLPDSTKVKNNENRYKFADTGVMDLINELIKLGIKKENMKAKIAGGARMFNFSSSSDLAGLGDKNVIAVKKVLQDNGIKLVSEDVGLNYGRTIIFDPSTFDLEVINAGRNKKII